MPVGDGFGADQQRAVEQALAELLAWEDLRRSPQLSAFLSYVVRARLRGDSASIKAYSVAVDVFGRGDTFDPQSDPIVRVQARCLRSLLAVFDASGARSSPVRITLPVGRYVPEFTFDGDPLLPDPAAETDTQPEPTEVNAGSASDSPGRSVWFIGATAVLILLGALVFWQSLARPTGSTAALQPQIPTIVVQEFQNLTSDQRGEPMVAGLAVEIVTDFNQFPDIVGRYASGQQTGADQSEADFVLSGVVRRVTDGIQYVALLRDADGAAVGEPVDLLVPLVGLQPALRLDQIAQRIVLRLASPRGPIHAPARAWLASEAGREAELQFYPCMVAFNAYRELRLAADADRVGQCANAAAASGDHAALGHAMLAALAADRAWDMGAETAAGLEYMALARLHLERAEALDPLDGFVWSQLAQVALYAGDRVQARDYYNSAVQLNPGAVDTVAGYANLLGLAGNWQAALQYGELAFQAEDNPPARYHILPALYALRSSDFETAIVHGQEMRKAVPEFGAAVLVAAGALSNRAEVVNSNLPLVLSSPRFRRLGIMTALRQQSTDPDLLRQLSTGLGRAGITFDRLAQPF